MSKNFELMQEALGERALRRETLPMAESATLVFPGTHADASTRAGSVGFDRVAQEECLKLVQRIYLGQPADHCRAVAFAGIDPGNGCSLICAAAASTLAANTSGSVCLVEAN